MQPSESSDLLNDPMIPAGPGELSADRPITLEDLNFSPPTLPEPRIAEIARELFAIHGTLQPLEGERDQNTLITTSTGARFVLKIGSAGESRRVADFQIRALLHLEDVDPALCVPRLVRRPDGSVSIDIETEDGLHTTRLLTYLDGIPYQQGRFPSPSGLQKIGQFLGRLDLALAEFSHPAENHFMPWDVTNRLMFHPDMIELLRQNSHSGAYDLLMPAVDSLEQTMPQWLPRLRTQVIHQDAHGGNLLRPSTDAETPSGLIDFGDMIRGPLICELAVCATHLIEDGSDPYENSAALCRGYNRHISLKPLELEVLPDLIVARLIMALQLFEFRRRHMQNPPAFVIEDQPGIITRLRILLALDREKFARGLEEACR